MAIRIRKDGRILCAAIHPPEDGDTYIDDGLHYLLSVERKLLVTEPSEKHMCRGEWWWKGSVPLGIQIEDFYNENPIQKSMNATTSDKCPACHGAGRLMGGDCPCCGGCGTFQK